MSYKLSIFFKLKKKNFFLKLLFHIWCNIDFDLDKLTLFCNLPSLFY